MSLRLLPLHEKMGAEDLRNTLANICADYAPDTKATVLLNMGDTHLVSILFYPDGADVVHAEVIHGATWVEALNNLIDRIAKGKT